MEETAGELRGESMKNWTTPDRPATIRRPLIEGLSALPSPRDTDVRSVSVEIELSIVVHVRIPRGLHAGHRGGHPAIHALEVEARALGIPKLQARNGPVAELIVDLPLGRVQEVVSASAAELDGMSSKYSGCTENWRVTGFQVIPPLLMAVVPRLID